MNKMLSVVFLVSLISCMQFCSAGTTSYHRETSLDELKSIDSLVSTGLPLFSNGFFIATGRGPVLVKKGNNNDKSPRLNPGYYSTLPRLIPQGYEGIATSHFNLGSAFPPHAPLGTVTHQQQPLQVPVAPVAGTQGQHIQQYQQQYFNRGSSAPTTYEEQQQPQQSQNYQTYYQNPEFQQEPQEQNDPQRTFQQRFGPQVQRQQPQSHVAQETFQIDNFLTPGDEHETPTSYQQTEFGHERFVSHKFVRNPTVERAVAVDETLPEGLKNPFYRNEQLASALAQESLPVPGEEVVGEWDTTKIQKAKIHELLRGAGFI